MCGASHVLSEPRKKIRTGENRNGNVGMDWKDTPLGTDGSGYYCRRVICLLAANDKRKIEKKEPGSTLKVLSGFYLLM